MTADTVTLRVPRDRSFRSIINMVLGGIALRRDLSLDALDDMQLAVENVLAEDGAEDGDITMSVTLGDDWVDIRLEALQGENLRNMLLQGQVPPEAEGHCIDLCRLLRSLVSSYSVRNLAEGLFAVEMRKSIR